MFKGFQKSNLHIFPETNGHSVNQSDRRALQNKGKCRIEITLVTGSIEQWNFCIQLQNFINDRIYLSKFESKIKIDLVRFHLQPVKQIEAMKLDSTLT